MLDLLVHLVQSDLLVHKVLLVHKARQAAQPVLLVPQTDQPVLLVQQVKVVLAHKVQSVLPVQQVRLVQVGPVHKAQQGRPAQVQLVLLAQQVLPDRLVLKVKMV